MMRRGVIALFVASCLSSAATAAPQDDLRALANGMGVRLTILDNKPAKCPAQASGCFLSELALSLPANLAPEFANGDFQLYFGSVSPVIHADSDVFSVRLVNGDLHVLEPRPGVRLTAGRTYRVRLWSQGHFFSAYYPLPNMFLASGNLQPAIIAATRPATDPDSGLEVLPFVAPMTDEARLATASADDRTRWQTPERAFDLFAQRNGAAAAPDEIAIIPRPALVRQGSGAPVDISRGLRLTLTGVDRSAISPALADLAAAGVVAGTSGPELRIRVSPSSYGDPEAYRLRVAGGAVDIAAAGPSGVRYALESLAQQAAHDRGLLQPVTVKDAPRFGFRGLEIDLARNFHSKAEILKIVEQMGRYKLNALHLHLGDDEGWRLQIASLPELTGLGAYRCFDPSETRCLLPQLGAGPDRDTPVNGFVSRADYIDILKAAKARGIEVIPSFDMPGHSRAAVKSMELRYRRLVELGHKADAERFRLVEPGDTTQYRSVQNYNDNTLNVCLPATYRFIDAVLDELVAMHRAAGAPLRTYHIGADETAGAWTGSPACAALMKRTGRSVAQLGPMFIGRLAADLHRRGIRMAGWSDGLGHVGPTDVGRDVQSDIWGDLFTAAPAEANRAANLGWKTVIAVPNSLYFDMPYAPNPLERGYDWGTRGNDTFDVFSFMPDNLAANASIKTNIKALPATAADATPRQPGRTIAGAQANMWSETIRRNSIADYMLFPRLLAFAERAWRAAPWEPVYSVGTSYSYGDGKVNVQALRTDWSGFASRMPLQLASLEQAEIMYRLAPPGARIVGGILEANSEFPGQPIEYRTRGGAWRPYTAPVRVTGRVELRTRAFTGPRTSRVVEVGR